MNNQFANNAATLLASGITNVATSLTVTTGAGTLFPSLSGAQFFYCTLEDTAGLVREIVKVTARSGDTFTIVRAQEGTTASAFSTGAKVEMRLTAAGINNIAGPNDGTTTSSATTVTLTSSSSQVQQISMTAAGQYVVLPDATTISKNANVFTIINSGSIPFGVKDSAGNILVPMLTNSSPLILALLDNTTATGKWVSGNQPLNIGYGPVNVSALSTSSTNSAAYVVALSSTTLVFAFYYGSSASVVAATVSGTTVTFGTPVGVVGFGVIQSLLAYNSTTFAIVAGLTGASLYAGTVSGTTITLGTANVLTVVSPYTVKMAMIDSTTAIYASTNSATAIEFKAFTISGTTCSFGAAATVTVGGATSIYTIFKTTTNTVMWGSNAVSGNTMGFISNSGTTLTVGNTYTWATYWDTPIASIGTNYVESLSGGIYTLTTGNTISSFADGQGDQPTNFTQGKFNPFSANTNITYNGNVVQLYTYSTGVLNGSYSTPRLPISAVRAVGAIDSSTAVVLGSNYNGATSLTGTFNATIAKLLW